MVTGKVNNHLSAFEAVWVSKENRESGATPERYRHCKRGGGRTRRKPVIGIFPEKAVRRLVIRKVRITAKPWVVYCCPASMGHGYFWRRKSAAAVEILLLRLFVFRLPDWGSLLLHAGLPSRKTGLRVISSGGSLPTPPDFYCHLAVKIE